MNQDKKLQYLQDFSDKMSDHIEKEKKPRLSRLKAHAKANKSKSSERER